MGERLQCDIVLRGGITGGNVILLLSQSSPRPMTSGQLEVIGWCCCCGLDGRAALSARRGQDHFQTRIKEDPSSRSG